MTDPAAFEAADRYADHLDRMATWAGDEKHTSAEMIRGLAGEVAVLRARLEEAERDRDRLLAAISEKGGNEHYPTLFAYLAACEALTRHKDEANDLRARLEEAEESDEESLSMYRRARDRAEAAEGVRDAAIALLAKADAEIARLLRLMEGCGCWTR
jgi:hypothetical protein